MLGLLDVSHDKYNPEVLNKSIQSIVVKYLCKSASAEEMVKLAKWLENNHNQSTFRNLIKTNYLIDSNLLDFDTLEEKGKVLQKIKREEKKNQRRGYLRMMKYAAIFILSAGIGFYFVRTGEYQNQREKTTIAETGIGIRPGQDKAILTLENGSELVLEKGEQVKVNGLSKKGDKLIYENHSSHKQHKLEYNYLAVPRGGQFHVQLSDGTKVWLNSESKLKYPVSFIPGQTRKIELMYGEAYFDVSKSEDHWGSAFLVQTKIQEVQVLGTQFNIKAYKDEGEIITTLVEGEVTIGVGPEKQFLHPSEQSLVQGGQGNIEVRKVGKMFDEIAWKEGYFSFKSKSMKDIMKILSRWYDMEYLFENPEKENKVFTGVLDRENRIDQILMHLQKTNEISFEINDRTVIIK